MVTAILGSAGRCRGCLSQHTFGNTSTCHSRKRFMDVVVQNSELPWLLRAGQHIRDLQCVAQRRIMHCRLTSMGRLRLHRFAQIAQGSL